MGELGSIWIKLGAKISDFEKGMSDAEKAMEKVGAKFQSIGAKLTVTGAAITGAIGLIIAKTANLGDEFNDLAQRTGISVETLSAFKLAADKSGTSIEGFAVGMRGLANNMQEAATKGGDSKKIFDALGVSFQNADGSLRPLDQVMLDVADKFALMADGAQKTALAQDIFGKSGMALIPMLNQGRAGLEAEAAMAAKLGLTMSGETAQACDTFNDRLTELKGGLQGAGNQIAMALIPTLTNLIAKVTEIIGKVTSWAKEHPGLTKVLSATALGLGALATVLGTTFIAIGTVLRILPTLTAGIKAVRAACLNPIALTITVGTAAVIKALHDFRKSFKEAMDLVEQEKVKVSGLEKFLISLQSAVSKVTTGYDMNRVAAAKLAEQTQKAGPPTFALSGAFDALSKWLEKIKPQLDAVRDAAGKTGDIFSTFGLKTKTDLTKELEAAEAALANLRKSTERTPGAVATLEAKVKELKDQLYGVSNGLARTTEVVNTFLPSGQRMESVMEALAEALKVTTVQIEAALPPARNLAAVMDWLGPSFAGAGQKAEEAGEKTKTIWQEVSTVVSDACREIARSIVDVFGIQEALTYKATEFNNEYFERAKSEYEADYEARKSSIEKQIDAVKDACAQELKAIGDEYQRAMKEVDTYYDGVAKAAGKAYDEAADKARDSFDAAMEASRKYYDQLQSAEGHAYDQARRFLDYRYQDEDDRYQRQFEDEKEAIERSAASEEEKRKKIKALTRKYEDEAKARARKRDEERLALELAHEKRVEAIREAGRRRELQLQEARDKRLEQLAMQREKRMEQIALEREAREEALGLAKEAREEAAIARRTAAEQQFQLDLMAQQQAYQAEMDRIRKDEDAAREWHAKREEARQNSLWNKVKGIVATAIEEIATAWLTSKIVKAAGSIFDGIKDVADNAMGDKGVKGIIGKAATGIGNIFTGLATTIGTILTTLATAIGTSIVTIATGIAGAITVLATAIATAATTLAAAAPALAIVLGIALAAMAAWGAIAKLIGGGGKQTDVTYWLKLIKDLTQESHDFLFANLQDKLNFYAEKLNDIHLALLNIRDDKFNALLEKTDGLGTHLENITKLLDQVVKNTAAAVTQTASALTSMMGGMMSGGAYGVGPGVHRPDKPYVSPWRTAPLRPSPGTPFTPGPVHRPEIPYVPVKPGKPYPYGPIKPIKGWDEKLFNVANAIHADVESIAVKMGALVDIEFKAYANPRDISGPVIRDVLTPAIRDISLGLKNRPQPNVLNFYINALDAADLERITRGKIVPILQRVLDHNGLHPHAANIQG